MFANSRKKANPLDPTHVLDSRLAAIEQAQPKLISILDFLNKDNIVFLLTKKLKPFGNICNKCCSTD